MKSLVVFTTAPTLKEARSLASLVLKKKLAACVNIVPSVESHYRWNGKIERSKEYLLIIKTRSSRYTALQRALHEAHSYTTPEVIALPVSKGSPAYLKWIGLETGD